MDRRAFLKTGVGVVAFGGLFVVVGCGDDDSPALATPGSAVKTAVARTTPAGAGAALVPAGSPAATLPPRATSGSLYDRIGGHPAIQRAVDDYVALIAFDTRVISFFANVDAARLNRLLVEFFGSITGGPEKYTGRTMKATHAGLKIQQQHFDALMEDLGKALDKQALPARERAEIIALVNPLSADIVTA
jgi:hemoglobin